MPLAYIPFIDTAEVVFLGANSGNATYITMGFQRPGGFSTSDLDDLGVALDTWYHDNLIGQLGVAQSFAAIKITDLSSPAGPVALHAMDAPLSGTHTGDTIPVQVAMVVSLYTNSRGRSYRGRNYIPGLTLNQMVDGSNWGTSSLSAMNLAYRNLIVDLGGLGFNLVILSRFNAGVRRTIGVSTLVTNAVAKAPVGTQRRRVIGHGI